MGYHCQRSCTRMWDIEKSIMLERRNVAFEKISYSFKKPPITVTMSTLLRLDGHDDFRSRDF